MGWFRFFSYATLRYGAARISFALSLIAAAQGIWAGDPRSECDSCRFQVDKLDQPRSLAGMWLFTRDDLPQNKEVDLDTSQWRVIGTPGPWRKAYGDGQNFRIGWYRAEFDFSPDLVGQEVVLLMDFYMARVNVYLDGQEIFRRPGNTNIDRYYSIQPIPVRFKVTQTRQVLAIRVDTPLMTGVYQLPFDIRRYDPDDLGLAWYQFVGGDLRQITAYVALLFGLFFLVVYFKTRYTLYLFAALSSIVSFPFFATPGDMMLRVFAPEKMLFFHYLGVYCTFFHFVFCQYFYKGYARLNWGLGIVGGIMAIGIASMAFHFDLDLFQKLRSLFIPLMGLCIVASTYVTVRGTLEKRSGAAILMVGMLIYLGATINDFLLSTGRIHSVALLSIGAMSFTATMLFVASNIFANTFLENKELVKTLTTMNDKLEDLVSERTKELGEALKDLSSANNDLRSSNEKLTVAKNELVRSEKLAALGSLVAGIAHELNTPLGNGLMATSTLIDQTNELKREMSEKGPRRSSFEHFLSTVESSADITMRSLNRSATLVASFKQIAVDQTSSNRARFKLSDLVKDVLVVLQPKVQAKPYQVESKLVKEYELDSYPGPLGQVLTNLINNAFDHGFEGRDHGYVRVTVSPADKDDHVVIRVTDDGVGIAAEHLPKLFDPFFTTKLGQGSSGLGLHIVHNIVTQILGGTLDVSSKPGEGAEFTVCIPLVAPVAVKPTNAA